jgi:hypothetical protein
MTIYAKLLLYMATSNMHSLLSISEVKIRNGMLWREREHTVSFKCRIFLVYLKLESQVSPRAMV